MKQHLAKKPGSVKVCSKVPDDVAEKFQKLLEETKKKKTNKRKLGKYQEQAPTTSSSSTRDHHHPFFKVFLQQQALSFQALVRSFFTPSSFIFVGLVEFSTLHSGRLGLLEKLDVQPPSRILRQPSKLEPVPEKSDNVRSENPQPMDSQYE
ncbi:hypothetical protein PIB30_101731 [Stylosanthes scabra]|uniref:Uncharacterized protein n=1 Tax=Stylosanthes scabra TaxID=79078 RepID=A0ABU6VZG3_9FABA|nr:hypothetical protein [Stylosanthes scabra]